MVEGDSLAYVDTHCHLAWSSFTDLPSTLERARSAGVARILAVAVDVPSAESSTAMAQGYPEVFAAVGLHPNDLTEHGGSFERIAALARSAGVVAIGETGLDYYRDHTDPCLQRRSLDAHLALAAETGLPIIIHNRAADGDVIAAVAPFNGRVRGVMHCFGGDRVLAARALDLGYYISFAGNLTYPSAGALRDVAAWVPADRLLVETDAPFLSPVPKRGKANEPAYVVHTLAALAACRSADLPSLAAQAADNARTLFGW